MSVRNESTEGEGESCLMTFGEPARYIFFQKKHWFDADITIRWLKWLKDQFPGKKVGLIWDHAPAHTNKFVQNFLDQCSD